MRKLKKDKFFHSRGGICQVLTLFCSKCGQEFMVYQKDGKGALYRAYLNRILDPEPLASLQDKAKTVTDMSNLKCNCGQLLAVPMLHWEGRLAFRLVRGAYKKTRRKG